MYYQKMKCTKKTILQGLWKKSTPFNGIFAMIPAKISIKTGTFFPDTL